MEVADSIESTTNEPLRFGGYLLEKRIAVGGMSEVYLARPIEGESPAPRLVIKRMLPVFDDPDSHSAFELEARLHAAVRHPNVVEVYEAGTVSDEPFLAMEYVSGVDAFRLIRQFRKRGERLPPAVAIYIAREVCKALACVHRLRDEDGQPLGVVHRDVTPSNIYLSETGDVKLGDFGIARSAVRNAQPTASHVLKGKYAYLAPEQVAGEPFDHRADLFSLVVALTEMIIGRPLFEGAGQLAVLLAIRDCRLDSLHGSAHLVPNGLMPILEKGLAKEPAQRIADANELYVALARFEQPSRSWLRARLADLVHQTREAASQAGIRDSSNPTRSSASPAEPIASSHTTPLDPNITARFGELKSPDYAALLSETSALEIFSWIFQRHETGALFVFEDGADSARSELYFREGQFIHMASSDPHDLLGDYLVRRGAIERAELELALLAMPAHGDRLDETLLALGLVDKNQLLRAVKRQARDRAAGLFGWMEGRASFYRGEEPGAIGFPLDLDIPQVMLAGLEAGYSDEVVMSDYADKLDRVFYPIRPAPDYAKSASWPSSVLHVLGTIGADRRLGDVLEELHSIRRMPRAEALRALIVGLFGGIITEKTAQTEP